MEEPKRRLLSHYHVVGRKQMLFQNQIAAVLVVALGTLCATQMANLQIIMLRAVHLNLSKLSIRITQ